MRGISVASNPSPIMVTLPKPNGGFRWTQPFDSRSDRALVCEALEPFAHHFFTTRAWKLGERTHDTADAWKDVVSAAHVGDAHFGRLHQVHGRDAAVYKRDEQAPGGVMPMADIVITDDPAIAVAVQTADCVPLLFVDR